MTNYELVVTYKSTDGENGGMIAMSDGAYGSISESVWYNKPDTTADMVQAVTADWTWLLEKGIGFNGNNITITKVVLQKAITIFDGGDEPCVINEWDNSQNITAETLSNIITKEELGEYEMQIAYTMTSTEKWGSQLQIYSGENQLLGCTNMEWAGGVVKTYAIPMTSDWLGILDAGVSLQGWNITISKVTFVAVEPSAEAE